MAEQEINAGGATWEKGVPPSTVQNRIPSSKEGPLVLFRKPHGVHFSLEPGLLLTLPGIHLGRTESLA